MRFRIGINVGDVMVKDGDLFGDGVNVAARLEGLVIGGEICVSRGVRDHLRHRRGIVPRNDNLCWCHCERSEATLLQIIVQIAPFRIGPVDQVDLLLP